MKFEKMWILESNYNEGQWNMAIDEVLLKNNQNVPILRTYGWSKPCVSIGYFQSIREIDYEFCKKNGIDVVRRITGGGAVFHDSELTYSFVTKEYPENILESYRDICKLVVEALSILGIRATFSPLNDITVDGKKVCGNAQTRKNKRLLQHGTILLDVDKTKMFSVLKIPMEKISGKADIPSERVVGIMKTFEAVQNAIKISAKKVFETDLQTYQLGSDEENKCKELVLKKYGTKKWTFRR